MQVETIKKLFTVDEYYRMAEAGILKPEDRVELIDGEIIEMSPIGQRHFGAVNRATRVFITVLGSRAVVHAQGPLRLSNYTEPEPDVVLLKPRADDYSGKFPTADDAFLVLEIAETSLSYDRKVKVPRYAAAGIPEVWIENLKDDVLLIYRNLVGAAYSTSLVLGRGESVSLVTLPDVVFSIDNLLV
jgi:Uma2 family endonuclease